MNRRGFMQAFGAITGATAAAPAVVSLSSIKAAMTGVAGLGAASSAIGSNMPYESDYCGPETIGHNPFFQFPQLRDIETTLESEEYEHHQYQHMRSWSQTYRVSQLMRDRRERRIMRNKFYDMVNDPVKMAAFALKMGWKAIDG